MPHVQQTNRQYHVPEIGQKIAYKAHRAGVAARFPAPAVPKSLAVALALIGHSDARRRELEWAMVTPAKHHAANPLYGLQPVPGLGKLLRLGRLDAIHDLGRCPRVQDCVSSGRLGTCAQESAGKRYGTSGTKIGHADLKGAFAEAAVLLLRNHPAGHKSLGR